MELKDILLSHEHGAAELLKQAVEWIAKHPDCLAGANREGTLRVLSTTRHSMAGFAFLAEIIGETPDDKLPEALREIESDLATAEQRTAVQFARILRGGAKPSIATLSRSSSVLAALSAARDAVGEVHVLESRPGGEGRQLAEDAKKFLKEVSLHEDDKLEALALVADMGVIGADTVFEDGAVLNKVLSARLAEAFWKRGKPFYVLATTWKSASIPSTEYEPEGRDAPLFEVVPAKWITAIISEEGLLVSGT